MQVVFDAEGRVVGRAGSAVDPYPDPGELEAGASYVDACARRGREGELLASALTRVLSGASPNESFVRAAADSGMRFSVLVSALEPSGALLSIEPCAPASPEKSAISAANER